MGMARGTALDLASVITLQGINIPRSPVPPRRQYEKTIAKEFVMLTYLGCCLAVMITRRVKTRRSRRLKRLLIARGVTPQQ